MHFIYGYICFYGHSTFKGDIMLELYKNLSYGQKKDVCIVIANYLNKSPKTIRNWFISVKNIPEEHSEIVLKFLQLETLKMNVKFQNDPEIIFEMNRKYRELQADTELKNSIKKAKKNWGKIADIDLFLDEIKGY